MSKRYPMIIPCITKDYIRNRYNYKYFFKYLPMSELNFIGPADLEALILEDFPQMQSDGIKIHFINENDIVPFSEVKAAMSDYLTARGFAMASDSNPGWYYQQFLKLSFSNICNDEYYFSWDADTIPVKPITFFSEDNHPYFDIKMEYHKGYFNTIERLFPECKKCIDKSFISEHMLFSVKYVKEMLERIGDNYPAKILNAISVEDIALGFSEFETFGTYMLTYHPNVYTLRDWSSMRKASFVFKPENLTDDDISWLSIDYDAVSFEGYMEYEPNIAMLFNNPQYRALLTPAQIYNEFLNSGFIINDDTEDHISAN